MTNNELEQHLWEAANILRGPVDAADFKTYIFPLLFFKRISDVYDEEFAAALGESGGDEEYASFAENHRFQIPGGTHWRDVFERTENIGFALQKALREIERANPDRLYGIFGDAQWANKDRLSDRLLSQLLDHFNRIDLSNAAVREDLMGHAYEYLVKKFADASKKKAGEFYTPRTVVRLMVNILDPKRKESIYDPACGTGGMLLEAVHHVRESGAEWRNLVIRGQEKNLTTQSIARMNLFLHGVEDFEIARGDTLRDPAFHRLDELERFHCVIANPPFSLKAWGRDSWTSDPYGRNRWGLPPDSKGDLAWVAHMLTSMLPKVGRMAVVLPFGALFRGHSEGKARTAILQDDLVEAVIALGPNLFYGTGIPAAIWVLRSQKPPDLQKKVFLVDASEIYTRERAQNLLTPEQSDEIFDLYRKGEDVAGRARWVTLEEVASNEHNLSMSLYIEPEVDDETPTAEEALADFDAAFRELRAAETQLVRQLRDEGLAE